MIYSSFEYEKKQFDIFYLVENQEIQDSEMIFTGEIKDINLTNKMISLRLSSPPYNLKKIKVENLESLDYTPKKGDITEILVNKTEKDNLTAEKILIYERWKHDLIYIRSLPAIPFAIFLFFKAYRFNKKTFRFERRKHNA
ncbi:hypothetical protein AYK21_04745 [Thermoplasmatales archaeon SG8-52-2]|nr:MAG: hypothetical protein AYK21_04745 [Thermoplasmatales archaeon SG8-52-2]